MKNLFLTAVLALSTLAASAQFMVVTTYDADQTENMDKITANMGFGYTVMDGITVGLVRSPGSDAVAADTAAGIVAADEVEDSYDFFLRYDLSSFMDGAYFSLQAPREDASDNMKVGVGMSFSVWNSLYLEPSYMMSMSKDAVTDEREGSFNVGIGYRF